MKSLSESKGSSRKKRLVIISIILTVVLIVGGFFAWKFFSGKEKAEVTKSYGKVTR